MQSEFEFILVDVPSLCGYFVLAWWEAGVAARRRTVSPGGFPPPPPLQVVAVPDTSWAAGVILRLPDVLQDPRLESKLTTCPVEVMALLLVVVSAPVARPFLLLFASFI